MKVGIRFPRASVSPIENLAYLLDIQLHGFEKINVLRLIADLGIKDSVRFWHSPGAIFRTAKIAAPKYSVSGELALKFSQITDKVFDNRRQ